MWCDSVKGKFSKKWNTNPVDGHRPHCHWNSNRIDLQSLWGQKLQCGKNPPLYFLPACNFDKRLCFLTNLDLLWVMYVVIFVPWNMWKVDEASGKRSSMNFYRQFLLMQFGTTTIVTAVQWHQYNANYGQYSQEKHEKKNFFLCPTLFFSLEAFFVPSSHDFCDLVSLWGSLHISFHMMLPCLSEVMESRNSRSNSHAHAFPLSESALLEPRKLTDGTFDQST